MTTFVADKDPNADLDYSMDWTAWLDGDTLATSEWFVAEGYDETLEIYDETNSTTESTVWMRGGTKNVGYIVTNRITTAAGRKDDRSVAVTVLDK